MADFRAIPQGAYDRVAMLDAPLAVCNAFLVAVSLADDWGRFEGSPKLLARRLGCERDEAQDMLADLMGLGLVRIYSATDTLGQTQQVAEVVGYHSLRGHMQKVSDPSKRRDSQWPPEPTGTECATHAHTRAHDARTHARTHAPITGAGARPSRGRDALEESRAEQRRADLSPPQRGEREQRDPGEHVASQEHPNSASASRGPVGTGPLEGGPSPVASRHPPIEAYDNPQGARVGPRRTNGAKVHVAVPDPPRKSMWDDIEFDPEFSERPE